MMAQSRQIEDPEVSDNDDVGEVPLSEYLMLLLAVNAFAGHVEDLTANPANDAHTMKGIALLRQADMRYRDAIQKHIIDKLPNPATKAMVERSFKVRLTNETQVGRRV